MPVIHKEAVILAALVGGAMAKMAFGAVTRRNRRQKMVKVGTVSELVYYPVKSCRGISVQEASCTLLGLTIGKAADRNRMVVRSNGDFVTQRQYSKMALIQIDVDDQTLVVNAPDMPTLTLPLEQPVDRWKVMRCRVWDLRSEGLDCGDEAAFWFSTFLKVPGLRVLYAAADLPRRDLTLTAKDWGNPCLPGDSSAFADFTAYLVTTEGSLAALNERLEEKVIMKRFRPNIVIADCPAFDEDNWSALQIGESATIRMLDPCTRCVMTTVDPYTGERDKKSQPLETLKAMRCFPTYGASPIFGVNATVDVEGTIHVGDDVYAIRK